MRLSRKMLAYAMEMAPRGERMAPVQVAGGENMAESTIRAWQLVVRELASDVKREQQLLGTIQHIHNERLCDGNVRGGLRLLSEINGRHPAVLLGVFGMQGQWLVTTQDVGIVTKIAHFYGDTEFKHRLQVLRFSVPKAASAVLYNLTIKSKPVNADAATSIMRVFEQAMEQYWPPMDRWIYAHVGELRFAPLPMPNALIGQANESLMRRVRIALTVSRNGH